LNSKESNQTRKKQSVFKTAERCAGTICFGNAFSCLKTKSFTLKTKENLMKVFVLRQLKASPKQVVQRTFQQH
jgi:hypothetical protein